MTIQHVFLEAGLVVGYLSEQCIEKIIIGKPHKYMYTHMYTHMNIPARVA